MYRFFIFVYNYDQCYSYCLPAKVCTVCCLTSIELPTVYSSREDKFSVLLQGEYWEILSLGTGFSDPFPAERELSKSIPAHRVVFKNASW